MSYGNILKSAWDVLTFKENGINELSENSKASGLGFLTLILAGLAMFLGNIFLTMGIVPIGVQLASLPMQIIFFIIGFFISFSIYQLLARFVFGGKGTGVQYFRVLSNTFIVYVVFIIPYLSKFLTIPITLWILAVNVFVLMKLHQLSIIKAIIVVLIPIILVVILFGATLSSLLFM